MHHICLLKRNKIKKISKFFGEDLPIHWEWVLLDYQMLANPPLIMYFPISMYQLRTIPSAPLNQIKQLFRYPMIDSANYAICIILSPRFQLSFRLLILLVLSEELLKVKVWAIIFWVIFGMLMAYIMLWEHSRTKKFLILKIQ